MVTIGSLRYDIIADTSKFTTGMVATRRELTAASRVFMETRTPAERLGMSVNGLDNALKKGAISLDTYNRAMAQVKQQSIAAEGGLRGIVAQVQQQGSIVGTAIKGFVAYRAAGFAAGEIKSGFNLAAELETTISAFRVMTGSAEDTNRLVAQLRQYDAETTFSFADTTQAAKQLLNFGVSAKDIIGTLKALGDISLGDTERLGRLTYAFGQVNAAGRLMGTEVRQMVEAGFNPLAEISRTTGESMLSLQKRMADGAISASEVAAALQSATSEGGKFFGMVESRAKTTAGQIDLLRGQWNMFKADLATETLPVANAAVSGGNWALEKFKNAQEEWKSFMGSENGGLFNTVPTLGGNTKANKILNDLATYDSRVKAAEAEQGKQRTFDNIKDIGGSLFDAGAKTAANMKTILFGDEYRSGVVGVLGREAQWFATEQMKAGTEKWKAEKDAATMAKASLTTPGEKRAEVGLAPTLRKGSREEYQMLAEMNSRRIGERLAGEKKSQDLLESIRDALLGPVVDTLKGITPAEAI